MGVLLVVLFLIVPIVEIYVIVQVGQEIGALPTIALLLVESAIGAWLVKREGRRAWQALKGAVGTGRLPSRELADGLLIVVGSALLLTPGFLTDAAGLVLLIPPTRALVRRGLERTIASRLSAGLAGEGDLRRRARARRTSGSYDVEGTISEREAEPVHDGPSRLGR
jgi:UPF0716 protein FxsA